MPPAEKAFPVRLTLLFIVLLFVAVILYARHVTDSRLAEQISQTEPTRYTTYVYQINLEYPSDWQPTPGYNYDHYDGPEGYFGLSVAAATTSIDMLARSQTSGKIYGSRPVISTMTISGEPARLIMPSSDQDSSYDGQAELIVEYVKPVVISNAQYKYLLVTADKNHIQAIANSISFLHY